MKRYPTLLCLLLLCCNVLAQVSSGLWFPHQAVSDEVYKLLKKDGLKLSKEQIYSINAACLSTAILSLSQDGGMASPFATASFISPDGLVITNYHCVSRYIKDISTEENDYVKYGCWAENRQQEAPLHNLQVNQLLSCEDITDRLAEGLEGLSGEVRTDSLAQRAARFAKKAKNTGSEGTRVYAMMGGQQYIMARYKMFKDVRIVASPPVSLAMEGGDEVNWQWPRYSCDFAILRVYANKAGLSTSYKATNTPYHPTSYLKIARKSPKKGDFIMVAGFPTQTRQHIPWFAIDKIVNNDTRFRMEVTKAKMDYLKTCQERATGEKKSAYSVRISSINNTYTRSRGEINGTREGNIVALRQQEDEALQAWINASPERQQEYGATLIEDLHDNYNQLTRYNHMEEVFSQVVSSGATILPFAGKFEKLLNIDRANRKNRDKAMQNEMKEIRRIADDFFEQFDSDEDCGMMQLLVPYYIKEMDPEYLEDIFKQDFDMERLYAQSLLTDRDKVRDFLDNAVAQGTQALQQDTLYNLCLAFYRNRVARVTRDKTPFANRQNELYSTYMRAYSDMLQNDVKNYDANKTLRLSPGKVKDYSQKEGLPIHCCLLANAETSSGNSGSPVVNAKGELVGLNFDREESGLSSIYRKNPDTMRNIMVDIQYVLWLLKNKSRSQYVLDELLSR